MQTIASNALPGLHAGNVRGLGAAKFLRVFNSTVALKAIVAAKSTALLVAAATVGAAMVIVGVGADINRLTVAGAAIALAAAFTLCEKGGEL